MSGIWGKWRVSLRALSGPRARWLVPLSAALGLLLLVASAAPAQTAAWALSPYQVEIVLQARPSPRMPRGVTERLAKQLDARIDGLWGGAWRVTWRIADPSDPGPMRDLVAADSGRAIAERGDVALVVVLSDQQGSYQIDARQQSQWTLQWGPAVRFQRPSLRGLEDAVLQALAEAFVPIVEVQRVEGEQVEVEARAAELLPDPPGPFAIQPGDFLQPVVGYARRGGRIDPDGIRTIEWTLLHVQGESENTIDCRLYSAYRQPLRSQRSARLRQWAHPLRVAGTRTTLRMTDRQDPPRPLVHYQILARSLDGKQPLGELWSDWEGEVVLDAEVSPAAQLLLVRHGERLLARLPVVIGAQDYLTVPLAENPALIAADAFVHSVQQDLLDLMVRRKLMGLHIQQLLKGGRVEQAADVLQELRQQASQNDFLARIQSQQQRLATGSPAVQGRIDKLFADTRRLLAMVLDPGFVQKLQTAVAQGGREP